MKPPRTIPIASPCTGEEEIAAVAEPIRDGWLTQGPRVAAFERAFAERHGVARAMATSSCTTALHLALVALGIGPGDEVIVPSFTWVATANVVLYCGATPVLADVDPHTYNLDPNSVRERVTDRTRAVIPVHLFGLCADMDAIATAAPGVPLLEDAACAAGATYAGKHAGSLGAAGAFSFHPRKTITTGEGGMVTTNDVERAELVTKLRNHGASISEEQRHVGPKPYLLPEFGMMGFNYRMTDLQGAVGLAQLGKLDRFLAERDEWARYYQRELADLDWLTTPSAPDGWTHGWQSFVCTVDEQNAPMSRNDLMEHLQDRGISTRPGTHAVHTLAYYRDRFGLRPEELPHSWRCARQTLALPLHNRMTDEDYRLVVDALHEVSKPCAD